MSVDGWFETAEAAESGKCRLSADAGRAHPPKAPTVAAGSSAVEAAGAAWAEAAETRAAQPATEAERAEAATATARREAAAEVVAGGGTRHTRVRAAARRWRRERSG